MSGAITFEVPGKPQPKQRARRGKGGRWYTPKPTRDYETRVGYCGRAAFRSTRFEGPVSLALTLYMPDRRRRDFDNIAKSIADGLNGIAYRDDSQIARVTIERRLDRDNPRAVVSIGPLSESGGASD